jgi:hypothetical protein
MIHTESNGQKLSVAHEAVRAIGLGLDRQVFPRVKDGGVVLPNGAVDLPVQMGKEQRYVEPKRGSAAGSRQGTTRRQGTPGGSWAAGPAAPLVRRSSAAAYEEDLRQLTGAYPMSQVWFEKDGIWLVAHSTLVEGMGREAVFVVAIPFDPNLRAQGWGFWSRGSLAFAQWIGPRHTNFPFGSICAFDPEDNAWSTGDSPTLLLDLYTVWAVRHLFLEFFGRWPGSQTARWPYERRLECREDELCGCGSLTTRYSDCCLSVDLQRDTVRDALSFMIETHGGERAPPIEVIEFLRTQSVTPQMSRYL